MSMGIIITSEPDHEIDGWFHHFATDFECVNHFLKNDGCDLSSYLYCPESFMSDEDAVNCGYSEESIAHMNRITKEEYFPIQEVIAKIKQAIDLVKAYSEDRFQEGKEPFLTDLQEVEQHLSKVSDADLKVMFLRA